MRTKQAVEDLQKATTQAISLINALQAAGLPERKAEHGMTGFDSIDNKVWYWLSMFREAEGLTLKEVSEKCGLSISFLSDVEHGRTNPSIDSLLKILAVYNLTIEIVYKQDGGGN